MIGEPRCSKRGCANFLGIARKDINLEETEFPYCEAFPEGIPENIAYGTALHLKPTKEQDNFIVFEKEEEEAK